MSTSFVASREELTALVEERARELREVRQQQTVTGEVLRAISRPDFDLGAVLDTLTKSAADLCDAGTSSLFLREGDRLFARGTANLDEDQERFVRGTAAPIDDTSYIGRAVLHGTVANIPDFLAWTGSRLTMYQQKLGFRAMLVVPLMRDGQGIGVFTLARTRLGEFSARQVELVQAFADQAVIAVQNARLIDELQLRTDELARSLEQLQDAQERLARSERLASLGRLVAGVAHEMNTPVGNALTISTTVEHDVQEMAQTLQDGDVPRHELVRRVTRLRQGSALIRTNLSRAIDLIQRFRQVASAKADGERRRIDIRTWAETQLSNHRALAESGHAFRVECPDGVMAHVYPGKWSQILDCFIENSLQHAFQSGPVGQITLSVIAAGPGEIVLRYGDSGRGIPAGDLANVFDPFFTTARGRGAAGLGLHIVHNLVASMGGQIAVESRTGEGASFMIQLPAA